MVARTSVTAEPGERTIVMTREFDAPRVLVFRAHIDPEAIPRWWGRRNHTTTVDELDARPGGRWRYIERGADGSEFAFRGEYREISFPERIVYTFEFEGMPGHIAVETATFEERDGKTLLTVSSVFDSVEDRDGMLQSGMEAGANETWDRLDEYLAATAPRGTTTRRGDVLVITRDFDAPRALVWKAWTEPEHVMRWWGPETFASSACTIDFRVGGRYLFHMRSPEGDENWTTGSYREIVPLERIVATNSFADADGNVVPATHYGMGEDIPLEMLQTVTFEDLGAGTRLTLRHVGLPSAWGELAGAGWNESLDKLAVVLRTA